MCTEFSFSIFVSGILIAVMTMLHLDSTKCIVICLAIYKSSTTSFTLDQQSLKLLPSYLSNILYNVTPAIFTYVRNDLSFVFYSATIDFCRSFLTHWLMFRVIWEWDSLEDKYDYCICVVNILNTTIRSHVVVDTNYC